MGRLRLGGKGAWRCAERRERWEKGPSPSLGPRAATLAHGMERKKAGIPTASRTMGRDEEALP